MTSTYRCGLRYSRRLKHARQLSSGTGSAARPRGQLSRPSSPDTSISSQQEPNDITNELLVVPSCGAGMSRHNGSDINDDEFDGARRDPQECAPPPSHSNTNEAGLTIICLAES